MAGEIITPAALLSGGLSIVTTGVGLITAGEYIGGGITAAVGFGLVIVGVYLLSKNIIAAVMKKLNKAEVY